MTPLNIPILVAEDVADALAEGRAVVALESTVITHGMPYPENAVTARNVEDVVMSRGAIPATIAVIDGVIRVGLSEDLDKLAADRTAAKASSRDLAAVMARKGSAGTTVSATMRIAELSGGKSLAANMALIRHNAHVAADIAVALAALKKQM